MCPLVLLHLKACVGDPLWCLIDFFQLGVVLRELRDRDEALKQFKLHLQVDLRMVDHVFDVSDWFFLKLRPHG